jgi:thioredoxin 1
MKKNLYRPALGSRRLGLALCGLFVACGCNGPTDTLTDATFQKEVLESANPVLVDFWASWCKPCTDLAPTIDELAREYAGRVKVGKLNVDSEKATARAYEIDSIPAVILFKGGKVVDRLVGGQPKENYRRVIDKALEGGSSARS